MRYRKGPRADIEEQTLMILSAFEPMSYLDLAEEAGITPSPSNERLRSMTEVRCLHISGYVKKASAPATPMFSIGRGVNARPPAKQTEQEKQRKHRAKIKAEQPEVWKARARRQWVLMKKRLAENVEYAAKRREDKMLWNRKKFGSESRALTDPKQLQAIAEQFGITWRKAA